MMQVGMYDAAHVQTNVTRDALSRAQILMQVRMYDATHDLLGTREFIMERLRTNPHVVYLSDTDYHVFVQDILMSTFFHIMLYGFQLGVEHVLASSYMISRRMMVDGTYDHRTVLLPPTTQEAAFRVHWQLV